MSEAEVGVFVQRLRGLMNEIGEGPGMGRRRAFRFSLIPDPPHLPASTPKRGQFLWGSLRRDR